MMVVCVLFMVAPIDIYGPFMKKIITLISMLFIYMLSASAPIYADSHAKAVAEDATNVDANDEAKKDDDDEEEPDCD